jgi:Protein of unknown function (DUF3570)
MRLQLSRGSLAARAFACAFACLGVGRLAHADEASGTWTGEVEGRGNYFYERSTRVIVPTFKLETEAPSGVRLGAEYLVDVIASASIAQTGGGADAVFTELRHGAGLHVGKAFALGASELDLTVHGRYSAEDDYRSRVYGLASAFTWNEKTTTATLGVTRVDDTIESNSDATFEGELSGVTLSAGLSQVVSPRVVLGVNYQLGYLQGFLSNAYRRALIGPLPHAENHPSSRLRHNLEGTLSWFVPDSDTTLALAYRTYIDSWDIMALTPEARVYQQLGEDWVLRLRYRYYTQTRAYFYRSPSYPVGYTGPLTADPKMAELDSHQLGLKAELRLAFLGDSFLAFAEDAWLDLSLDRQFCSSSFGDNVIASLGARLPF